MWGCNRTGRATKRSCQARGGWGGLMTLGYIGASADIGHCGRHMDERGCPTRGISAADGLARRKQATAWFTPPGIAA